MSPQTSNSNSAPMPPASETGTGPTAPDASGASLPMPGIMPPVAESQDDQNLPPSFAVPPSIGQPTTPFGSQSNDNVVATTTNSNTPAMADDGDLIEKEWVIKAKQIVKQTQDNPYQQSQLIMQLKADYMQKRYNKTLKTSG